MHDPSDYDSVYSEEDFLDTVRGAETPPLMNYEEFRVKTMANFNVKIAKLPTMVGMRGSYWSSKRVLPKSKSSSKCFVSSRSSQKDRQCCKHCKAKSSQLTCEK